MRQESVVLHELDGVPVRIATERLAHPQALIAALDELDPAFVQAGLDYAQVGDFHSEVIRSADTSADFASSPGLFYQVNLAIPHGQPSSGEVEVWPFILWKPQDFAEESLRCGQIRHCEGNVVHALESDAIHKSPL